MKKLIIVLAVVCALVAMQSAYAASGSLGLSPATKSVKAGQTFTVTVSAVPSGGSVYTVKANMQYPANLVEVTGFSFAEGWFQLTQAGYDLVDNTSGTLIKTAGFPGGVSAAKTFGTVTFRAKAAGTATINTTGLSQMLDAANNNLYSGGGTSVVTISAAAPKSTVSPAATGQVTASPSATPTVEPEETASPSAGLQAAAILGLSARTWLIIIAVVVIALILYKLMRRRSEPPVQ